MKTCKNGHEFTQRCNICKKEYDRKRYLANPEPAKNRSKLQRVEHAAKLAQYKYAYRKRNPEYYAKRQLLYYNKRSQATPSWLTEQQKADIKAVYAEARRMRSETGVSYVVDHIIPIQGETVSGLHVSWNLQILENSENSKKNNKCSLTQSK